jgi:hypothetical protein
VPDPSVPNAKSVKVTQKPDPKRVQELSHNHEQGKPDLAEGAGGANYENAMGTKVQKPPPKPAGEGMDFVDPEVGPISLKGPLGVNKNTGAAAPITDKMAEGLGKSVAKDVQNNSATKRVVVDMSNMTEAQKAITKKTIADELAKNPNAPTKEIIFLE